MGNNVVFFSTRNAQMVDSVLAEHLFAMSVLQAVHA